MDGIAVFIVFAGFRRRPSFEFQLTQLFFKQKHAKVDKQKNMRSAKTKRRSIFVACFSLFCTRTFISSQYR